MVGFQLFIVDCVPPRFTRLHKPHLGFHFHPHIPQHGLTKYQCTWSARAWSALQQNPYTHINKRRKPIIWKLHLGIRVPIRITERDHTIHDRAAQAIVNVAERSQSQIVLPQITTKVTSMTKQLLCYYTAQELVLKWKSPKSL
jgi:hypothetical protein